MDIPLLSINMQKFHSGIQISYYLTKKDCRSSPIGILKICYIFAAKNPDACVGDESRINKVKRIFFFTAPKKEGFFFV